MIAATRWSATSTLSMRFRLTEGGGPGRRHFRALPMGATGQPLDAVDDPAVTGWTQLELRRQAKSV